MIIDRIHVERMMIYKQMTIIVSRLLAIFILMVTASSLNVIMFQISAASKMRGYVDECFMLDGKAF
jgi:hypothetical protein